VVGVHWQIIERTRGPALLAAQLIVAGIGYDAQQPGLEGTAAEFGHGLVSLQERVLGCIGRCIGIAENAIGHVVGHALVEQDQLVESREVALLGSGNERLLIHGSTPG